MGGGGKDATSGENSLSRGHPSGPWNWGSDWPCCPLAATSCRYRSSPGLCVLGGHLVPIPERLLHPWRWWSWEKSLSVTPLPHKAPDVSPRGSFHPQHWGEPVLMLGPPCLPSNRGPEWTKLRALLGTVHSQGLRWALKGSLHLTGEGEDKVRVQAQGSTMPVEGGKAGSAGFLEEETSALGPDGSAGSGLVQGGVRGFKGLEEGRHRQELG